MDPHDAPKVDTARLRELLRWSDEGFLSPQRFCELMVEVPGVLEALQSAYELPRAPRTAEQLTEIARGVAVLTGRGGRDSQPEGQG